MYVEITRIKTREGRVNPDYPGSGRIVARFNARVDDQLQINNGALRELHDGTYAVTLKDGPMSGSRCITLRPGLIRDAITNAAANAYGALVQQVAA